MAGAALQEFESPVYLRVTIVQLAVDIKRLCLDCGNAEEQKGNKAEYTVSGYFLP